MRRFVITVGLIALIAAGCGRKESPEDAKDIKTEGASSAKETADTVQHKVLSFNLEGLSEKGTKKWSVAGKSAEELSPTEVKLNNIVAKAYGEECEATIVGDKGVYDKTKNNVTLEENVTAIIENTQSFAASFADIPVRAKGPAKEEQKSASEKGKKAKTVITCDGEVQFDYEKNQAYFNRNVKVVTEDGIIDADRITVYMDPSTKKVKEIVAEGNVKITRGENSTYSEKATYVEAEKKIVLTGRPKIIIYQEGDLGANPRK